MPTKTIPLSEDAYERLKTRKREGESFSDVVRRLAGDRSWSKVAGILEPAEADGVEAAIEEGRRPSKERRDPLAEELDESGRE